MRNKFTAEQLELFAMTSGRELASAVASGDPKAFASRVPSAWIDLVAHPDSETIRALWEPAAVQLPRFVDYLSRSIDGAAIIETHGVPVLILPLPDWNEANCELGPGFCWIGTPTVEASIEQFVTDVGPIPASLEQLWRVANFITTKDHSLLCSLDAATHSMTEAPVVMPALADSAAPEELYECLQIAVVSNQMVTCTTRPPGQSHWDDYLVLRFRRTDQLSSSVRSRLDNYLADWTFTEWSSRAPGS